jgi:CSLREA domain-containing protein
LAALHTRKLSLAQISAQFQTVSRLDRRLTARRATSLSMSAALQARSQVGVAFRASHPYVGDLKVSLIAPNGRTHLLFERTGSTTGNVFGSSANLVATSIYSFVDAHIINWWTAAVIGGDVPSTEARSVVSGGEGVSNPPPVTELNSSFALVVPNGTWRLRFEDGAMGDTGEVTFASIGITVAGTTRTVTKTADTSDGICDAADCSLREALTAAQNGDLINFAPLFNAQQSIDLLTALPVITRSISIQGPGAQLLTVRRAYTAATDFRVFDIPSGVVNGVAIAGMTISNGRTTNFGGGILSRSRLTLNDVHVAGNTASLGGDVFLADTGGVFTGSTVSANAATGNGGGIFFEGNNADTLVMVNSTVSGNHSAGNAGGIRTTRGQLQLSNSTVAGNTAANAPGGIYAVSQTAGDASSIIVRNSIVSGNAPSNLAAVSVSGSASIQTQGFNLSDNYNGAFTPLASDITSATPRLAPLALYGGNTPTHALLHGSPAINAGNASSQPLDQRGLPRVFGTQADIGAVEMRTLLVTNANGTGPGSLRTALDASNAANDLDDILFDNTFFSTPRTIELNGQVMITNSVNIIAPSATLVTVSANALTRVFFIGQNSAVSLNGLTITGGDTVDEGGGVYSQGQLSVSHAAIIGNVAGRRGGGIYAEASVTTVAHSTISGNTANAFNGTGGGISHNGILTLTLTHSTVSGNNVPRGFSNGGGVLIFGSGQIINSTITNNSAAGNNSANGVYAWDGATVSLRNTLVAGNTNLAALLDVAVGQNAALASRGFNLLGNPGTLSIRREHSTGGANRELHTQCGQYDQLPSRSCRSRQ